MKKESAVLFTRIAFFKNRASVTTNLLFCSFVARDGRKGGKRQTDGQTVTLAAHVCRGLMTYSNLSYQARVSIKLKFTVMRIRMAPPIFEGAEIGLRTQKEVENATAHHGEEPFAPRVVTHRKECMEVGYEDANEFVKQSPKILEKNTKIRHKSSLFWPCNRKITKICGKMTGLSNVYQPQNSFTSLPCMLWVTCLKVNRDQVSWPAE